MASNFLKRKAEERAKEIDKQYGEGTYGSTSDLKKKLETAKKTSTTVQSPSAKSGGAETERLKSKASSFLQKKAVDASLRNARNISYNENQVTEGGNKDSWFKGGAFNDGYDFGDATKTVLGTVGDVGLGAVKGAGRMVEGLVDLGTYAVGGVGKLFGADEFWEDAKKVAQYSATDEWTKGATDYVDKYSVLGNKADAISEGLGQIAAIIATGGLAGAAGLGGAGVAAVTTGVTGLSAAGTNMGEAYESGATDGEAVVYGLSTGAIEAGTELLFGGLGKGVKALGISRGIGGLDDIFAKKLSNKVAGAFASEGVQKVLGNTIEASVKAGGEGFEEFLAGAGSAVMKKLTYMDDKELGELIEDENLLEQFVVGTIVSSIAQSPSYIKANKTGTDFVTGQTFNQERTIQNIAEQEIAEREANGEMLTNRERNKIYNDIADEVMSVAEIAPTSLEQAAMDVVVNRNATQNEKNQPISSVSVTEDSLPTQVGDYLKTPKNAQRNTSKGLTLTERLEAQSQNNETLAVEDVKKATAFGDEGAKLVTRLANREGVTFSQAERAIKTAYSAGFTDIKATKVNFDNSLQKRAFDAGKLDRGVQDRVAQANAKNATVYETGFTENEYSAKLTADEREMFTTMSKDLKMDTSFVDKIVAFYVNGKAQEANASHLDGKMEVSSTSQKPMVAIATHEGGHRMKQLAPTEFGVLMNALYKRSMRENAKASRSQTAGFDNIKSDYNQADTTMGTLDYFEEFAVRELETIFSSAEEFNKWRAELDLNPQAKSAWEKFIEIIKKVWEDMWAAITNSKMSLEAKRQAQKELRLFENAYRGAMKAAETRSKEVQDKSTESTETKQADTTSGKTDRMKAVLGDAERSVGVTEGQAFVTNGKNTLPSPTNRSVFLAVDNAEVAKAEFGATESNKTSENISKMLASDFVPVRESFVDGTLEGVGEVRVFTDENGREIALEKNEAEYFEGYNLEATFRGGKPYAIKATDNDGNVVGVAMAIWMDKSGQKYDIADAKDVSMKSFSETKSSKNLEIKTNEEYNGNKNYSLQDSAGANLATIKKLILSIRGRRGLKYDGGRVIRIPDNDMATLRHKFMTEHHYSNRSGGNIDCIDCFGQGGKKHYFYVFHVGEDNRVAPIFRLDYEYIERYLNDVQKISKEMGYNKNEFVGTTSGNGKGIDRIRNLAKSDSVYDVPVTREGTDYQSGEGYNIEGGGRTTDNGLSDSGLSNRYDKQSNNGNLNEGKKNFSLKDSEGNTLTEAQQEYFKDSKVRDENGNLLVVYHGTRNGGFTVFNRNHNYYTDSRDTAESYAPSGAVYEGYLNITKPYIIDAGGEKWSAIPVSEEVKKMLDSAGSSTFKEWGKWRTSVADIVAAISDLVDEGEADYDGVIVRNVDDTGSYYKGSNKNIGNDYISFSSEQFKDIDNKKPTSNSDIRFSLKEPVEETKNLVAVHNMQVSELERTLDLGGLPMPSIAIIKAQSGHSEYGDVSLVFDKKTIDPKVSKSNKVYGGDAWTPVYPKIEYKPDAKMAKNISDKYYELSRKFGYDESRPLYSYVYEMEEKLNRHKGEAELIEELYEDKSVMQLYLLDSGKGKVETINKETRTELTDAEVEMHEFFIKELGADVVDKSKWDGISNPKEYRKNYMSEYENAIREAYKKLLSEVYQFSDEQVQNVLDSTKPVNYLNFVRDAQKYRENGRVTIKKETDYEATEKAIREAAGDDYRKWIDSLFKGIEEKSGIRNNVDYFTNNGNRRSWEALHWENNLENVVKVMKAQDNGVAAFFPGQGIWAVSAKDYRSIDEIKADSDRLKQLPEEEYNKIKEGFGLRFQEIAESIMSKTERNPFIAVDNAMECVVEAIRNSKTKSGILKNLREYPQLTVTETTVDDIVSLVADISNMPTEYFEAKPKRAVELNEIATAIIPDNTSDSIKARLDSLGIKYVEYEAGNENARLEALNSLEDAKFSLKGGLSDSEIRNALANDKLSKYVDSGIISTEKYNELTKIYGAIHTGERPHRDVQVPRKSGKNKKVSQTIRTILEAQATPDEAVPTIEKMVEDGIFSYEAYSDKQAIADSEAYIKEYGWDESLDDWFDAVEKGEVSKELTTMGWALYNNAANLAATTTSETERTSAIKTSLKILDAMVRHQRSAAQALQATRILKKLSPETQLYGIQKSVSAFQNELVEKYGDKAPDLKIDEELAEQFINAKTPEERAAIEEEIYKDIGRQMPSRFIDKWNAWRYLAMLGNPRTHIRNIVGNAGFAPVVATKNLTATAIESIVYRVSGKKTVRGKALITGSKADRALLKAAWGDYGNVADMISNGGKYNDSAMANQQIEDGRRIFKFKPLEGARKGNSKLLELEDMWFSKPHYACALAQYCKAHNITAEQIQRGKAIAPAREYAIKEAQKATYRDTNAFSQMVSEWGRKGNNDNVAKKAVSTVIEGILPFRKTPANLLVRGVEYSPIGLLKGLSYDLYQVGKGKMSATEAIDNISAGLTGTGLLALGVYLAAQGLIRGHGEDEEEERKFKELTGHQAYSLELPNGQSVTLDWLAPEALPLFVGVNLWETTKGTDEETNLSSILGAVSNISEPMLEMSCLQGLNDLFEGIGYASSNDTSGLVSVVSSAVTSYLTQGIPTLSGQIERTGEEERMSTYTEKNGFLTGDMQYTLGKASAKIPFWDYNQIPYIDAWGRKEASGMALKRGLNNFLNPAYTSTIATSNMEKELLRLYEQTGEGGVFPERADKYFTVDGVRKDLTADEYVRYATLKGEKSYKLVSDLVNSKAYRKLSDEEKAKAVKEAYDYANQKAKQSISNYKPEAWVKKADEFGSNVGNYISFKTEVSGTKEENGGKISKQEVVDIILDMAQNDSETWKMYLSMYDGEKDYYAFDKGIEGETYMYFLESLNDVDEPTKNGKYGTYTQEEAERAVGQLDGLSRKEKAILYQSVNTSWNKNPFR